MLTTELYMENEESPIKLNKDFIENNSKDIFKLYDYIPAAIFDIMVKYDSTFVYYRDRLLEDPKCSVLFHIYLNHQDKLDYYKHSKFSTALKNQEVREFITKYPEFRKVIKEDPNYE